MYVGGALHHHPTPTSPHPPPHHPPITPPITPPSPQHPLIPSNPITPARHGFQCYMRDEIMTGWLLSESLAAKYTCVLFLFHSGFKVS